MDISGYGPDGPYAHRNAYDLVMQGEVGLMSVTGSPEAPARVGISVCDVGAGSYAAVAALAALLRRERTGEGARVSVSLFDTMVDWLGYFPHVWWHRGETPARTGMRHPHFCPYGPFPAADGRLVGLAVLSPAHWQSLCEQVLERPSSPTSVSGRMKTGLPAGASWRRCWRRYSAAVRRRNGWRPREAARIPCGAVNDLADVMVHPQLRHNRLVAEVGSPVGPLPTIGNPFLVAGGRPGLGPVPALGEHTDEVLRELGLPPRGEGYASSVRTAARASGTTR